MGLIQEKRGVSHFEMVFSFIFFIGFVFFLFLVLRPYGESTLTVTILDGLSTNFFEQTGISYGEVFLEVEPSSQLTTSDCFAVPFDTSLFALAYPTDFAIFTTEIDSLGTSAYVPSLVIPSPSGFLISENDFGSYKIQFSSEFSSIPPSCSAFPVPTTYTFANLKEEVVVSYKEFSSMKTTYDTNYTELKKILGIPEIFEFSIENDIFPELSMTRSVSGNVEVFSEDFLYTVIKEDGTKTLVKVVVKVW